MKNKQQTKTNTLPKDQAKKPPQLQQLKLEQLDDVVGAVTSSEGKTIGAGTVTEIIE